MTLSPPELQHFIKDIYVTSYNRALHHPPTLFALRLAID